MAPGQAAHKQYLCTDLALTCHISTFYLVCQKLGNGSQTGKEMAWKKLQEKVLALDIIRYERAEIQAKADFASKNAS